MGTVTRNVASGRRSAFAAGARAMVPWLASVVPYGLVIGITAAHAGVPTVVGWLTGPLVFAGTAQVTTIQLLDNGAAPLVVIAVALAVNLRLAFYSATMAQHWVGAPRWVRLIGAYTIVDPSVAVGVDGYAATGDPELGHVHYFGGAVTLWVAWLGAITVGATVCSGLPAGLHLELIAPLFLVGQVVPQLGGRSVRRGVSAAVVIATVSATAPFRLGSLVAIAGGLVIALGTHEAEQ